MRFHGEALLAPRPTPKLEDHLLSAVRYCLINLFAATLHIRGRSSVRNLRTRHAVSTETHLLHEELSDLYSLPNIVRVVKSRRIRWAGHVARMGDGRGVDRVLVGKHEWKRTLGRPRRGWEDNIKMDLQEVEGGCGDLMGLAQDRENWRVLVSTVMNFRVP